MSKNEKIQEILLNESFVSELQNLKTAEEVQVAFKNYGVDMTLEELNELCDLCAEVIKQKNEGQDGELSEESLSSVAGGVTDKQMKDLLLGIAKDILQGCWNDIKRAIRGR